MWGSLRLATKPAQLYPSSQWLYNVTHNTTQSRAEAKDAQGHIKFHILYI